MKKILLGLFALVLTALPIVAHAGEAQVPALPEQASDTAQAKRAEALEHNKNYTPPA